MYSHAFAPKVNMKKIIIEDIEVDLKISSGSKTSEKAIAYLTAGPFKIKGFRVLPSKYVNKLGKKLWVVPPSYKSKDGELHRLFHCEDKRIWKEIESIILNEYEYEKKESSTTNEKRR